MNYNITVFTIGVVITLTSYVSVGAHRIGCTNKALALTNIKFYWNLL